MDKSQKQPGVLLVGTQQDPYLLARDMGFPHCFLSGTDRDCLHFPVGEEGTATLASSHECSGAGMRSRDTSLS